MAVLGRRNGYGLSCLLYFVPGNQVPIVVPWSAHGRRNSATLACVHVPPPRGERRGATSQLPDRRRVADLEGARCCGGRSAEAGSDQLCVRVRGSRVDAAEVAEAHTFGDTGPYERAAAVAGSFSAAAAGLVQLGRALRRPHVVDQQSVQQLPNRAAAETEEGRCVLDDRFGWRRRRPSKVSC